MNGSNDLAQPVESAAATGPTLRLEGAGLKPRALALLLRRAGLHSGDSAATAGRWSQYAIDAAQRLRHRARSDRLQHDYRHFMHLTQEYVYDRAVERLFFVPTRKGAPLDELRIDSANRRHGRPYHPVHRLSLDGAISQLADRLDDFTFIDYGAGRGRALLLASLHPFRRIVGVEFARELHDDATMNIAQFPRSLMKCRNVECRLMDAVDFPIPAEKCVFFFNDPFDDEVMKTVLARITASYRQNPRRMYLISVRPSDAEPIDRLMEFAVVFERVAPGSVLQMRRHMLCPDQVQVFRTLV